MSDLRAQSLALCAVLYGLKATSDRFAVAKEQLSEAVAELLGEATHPFFAGIREEIRKKAAESGVQKVNERFHLPALLTELILLEKGSEERSTQCTNSPVDSLKSDLFTTPVKSSSRVLPVEESPDSALETQSGEGASDSEFSEIRKKSHQARLGRAVELYKKGISAELLSDKLNLPNKYKIHMRGNWSQFPLEKVAELGRIQYSVTQLCAKKGFTLTQVERVFENQPKGLIKVMYDSATASVGPKRRKTQ